MKELLPLAGVCIGALLAGLFTLISNRHNFERDLKRDELRLKQVRLDEIITYAISYFSSGGLLISAIDGVSKDIEANGSPYHDATDFLTRHDKEFSDNNESLEYCNAKLMVFHSESSDALNILWEYHQYLSNIRSKTFRSGELSIPSQSEMKAHLKFLGDKRSEFFSKLVLK
ncbi:hypothetical protein [Vibrio scophthalmi]|uniref:Uncharacterized protein n=1 Tax=Vibrio scophthalmi TaxID=45658 RepID=A0A1C7FES7_9VIBR|nr:hypothetical protein [Vibrio scophthalmi]ANU38248.1 hypothetical protein VSVS05_03210 [Vibrio scophthalmi]